jgi:hypothetical protein
MTTPNSENDRHKVIYTRTGGDPITPDSINKSKRTALKFFAVVFGLGTLGAAVLGLGSLAVAILAAGLAGTIGLVFSAKKAHISDQHKSISGGASNSLVSADSLRKAIDEANLPEAIATDLTNSLNELVEKGNSLTESKASMQAALSRIPVADTELKLKEAIDQSDASSASIHAKTLGQVEKIEVQIEKIETGLATVRNGMLTLQSAVRTASLPTPVDTEVDISEIELQARALVKISNDEIIAEPTGKSEENSNEINLAAAAAMLAKRQVQ